MLNMDFSETVAIQTLDQDWVASPAAGVWRKPLAREDAERGHATSIVKYEAGAAFSAHGHPKGEEILVLQGVFSDESGDYPAGTYFRNPEGFSHAPYSKEGCVILVKLHQFQAQDRAHVCIDTRSALGAQPGVCKQLLLHQFGAEKVEMIRCVADSDLDLSNAKDGLEIYLISGCLTEGNKVYFAGQWLRKAAGGDGIYRASAGSLIWVKSNHLSAPL
ncbi:cupin domain-containing protein [Amphritea sp. HPY]|uniref:cupin domain-containing protein n=1 Tax=Amphritea sp. HPY TaxID=3421652 RepID=UPI003D7D8BE2